MVDITRTIPGDVIANPDGRNHHSNQPATINQGRNIATLSPASNRAELGYYDKALRLSGNTAKRLKG
jgi:hypothetical protein